MERQGRFGGGRALTNVMDGEDIGSRQSYSAFDHEDENDDALLQQLRQLDTPEEII